MRTTGERLDFRNPIDHRAPRYRPLLEQLQANILRPHWRRFGILLAFDIEDAARARAYISGVLAARITTAARQLDDDERGERVPVVTTFCLSRSGYAALGEPLSRTPRDPRFREGMKVSRPLLNDPPVERWESPYRQDIHALLLIASDDEKLLDAEERRAREELSALGRVRTSERGCEMYDARGNVIEHFGFVDGRSQPLFLEEDLQHERDVLARTSLFDPSAGLSLVLDRDPGAAGAWGSYLVFRKLEQDVRRFHRLERALAEELGHGDPELAGAMVIGRFRDGTPVAMHERPRMDGAVANNFDFDSDSVGLRCPFQSHIRKCNPRGDEMRKSPQLRRKRQILAQERTHRIARRGITYGERDLHPHAAAPAEALPEGGVGLLFMCFQSNITDQFEHIQGTWANALESVRRDPPTGRDPLIGQPFHPIGADEEPPPSGQVWPRAWGSEEPHAPFNFSGCVRMLGGEYFFAPSLKTLRAL
jgi:Dyp-type peroxidase family